MKLKELEVFCETLKNQVDQYYAGLIDRTTSNKLADRYEKAVFSYQVSIDKFFQTAKQFGEIEP